MPTLLDVADVDYPENLRPLDRKIIFSAFIEQPAEKPDPMYFQLKYAEAVDQKAIVQWPWKGWYNGEEGWSLYRLDRDWAETVDLKKDCPDQLRTMVEAYEQFDAAAQRDQQRYGSEFLPHKRINK